MNERIKSIRQRNKLSQEAFGERLGITKSSVSLLESGKNNPSEQTIMLICREFFVNEVWLRTGEGGDENMFTKISEDDRYSINLAKLGRAENELVKNMVNVLAETSPEGLKYIEAFMKGCLGIK